MKLHILPTILQPHDRQARGMAFQAKTTYPTEPVLQGKFLLSLGEVNLQAPPGFPHGDHAVASTMDYFSKHYTGANDHVMRTVKEDEKAKPRIEEEMRKKDAQSVFQPGSLAGIAPDDTLEIIGHGESGQHPLYQQNVVLKMGGLLPEELADFLLSHGLPETFDGFISLTGCSTGTGKELSYAASFGAALFKKAKFTGTGPRIAGYKGAIHIGKLHDEYMGSTMMVEREINRLQVMKGQLWPLRAQIAALQNPQQQDEKPPHEDWKPLLAALEQEVTLAIGMTSNLIYLDGFEDSDRAMTQVNHGNATSVADYLSNFELDWLEQCDSLIQNAQGLIGKFNVNPVAPTKGELSSARKELTAAQKAKTKIEKFYEKRKNGQESSGWFCC